jgi:hypothetical protein
MPDTIMYHEDHYVVLPPTMQEQFVTLPELEGILRGLLEKIQDQLPVDLQKFPEIDDQVQRLVKTCCDLECGDQGVWQWYVVRI